MAVILMLVEFVGFKVDFAGMGDFLDPAVGDPADAVGALEHLEVMRG
jgi:hypothetical protein